MAYHSATIKYRSVILPGDDPRKVYTISTQWSEHDRPHDGSAYTLESEGHKILRWDSNDAVVPGDIIAATDWPYADEMNAARDAQLAEFAAAYREARRHISPEQRAEEAFERRAAFGEGETVVDIISGERFIT